MRELDHHVWRKDAQYLLEQLDDVRGQNTEAYWRDMSTSRLPRYRVEDCRPRRLLPARDSTVVQRELASKRGRVSLNEIALSRSRRISRSAGSDERHDGRNVRARVSRYRHRVIDWLRNEDIDWARTMVLITGRTGRATSGFTWATNNMCHLIWRASGKKLPPQNLHIAPHAPSLVIRDNMEPEEFVEMRRNIAGSMRAHWRAWNSRRACSRDIRNIVRAPTRKCLSTPTRRT